jgi:hypothetical protein
MSNPLPQSNEALPDPDELMAGSGSRKGRSLSFLTVGTSHTMIVKEKRTEQKRDDNGDLEFWGDGGKKLQVVVTGQTDYRSPEIEDDDGIRYLYVDGSKAPASKSKMAAVIGAYEAAGCAKLEIGGELTITYVGDGPRPGGPKNPPKFYEARFVPAADVALRAGNLGGSGGSGGSNGHAPAATNGNGAAAGGLDWSQLGHLPADIRVKIATVPGLTTEAVLAMYPAPAPEPASNGTAEFSPLRREDFPGVDERQWAAIKEAVEQKGASVEAMKMAFAVG